MTNVKIDLWEWRLENKGEFKKFQGYEGEIYFKSLKKEDKDIKSSPVDCNRTIINLANQVLRSILNYQIRDPIYEVNLLNGKLPREKCPKNCHHRWHSKKPQNRVKKRLIHLLNDPIFISDLAIFDNLSEALPIMIEIEEIKPIKMNLRQGYVKIYYNKTRVY